MAIFPKQQSSKTRTLTCIVTTDQFDDVKALGKRHKLSTAELIRNAINHYEDEVLEPKPVRPSVPAHLVSNGRVPQRV